MSVYGPVRCDSAGSIWQQQKKGMQSVVADQRMDDPRQQFLYDLYNAMWRYSQDGWMLVIGGDFNLHWNGDLMGVVSSGGVGGNIKGLRQFAEALHLVNVMQETGGGDLPTFRRSEAEGAAESTPDHVLVSASILGSGAVTGAAVWYGDGFDSTDHSPVVVDLDLWKLLNLDVDEDVPLPAKPRVEKLRLDDDGRIGRYQVELVRQAEARQLMQRMHQIELEVAEVVHWQAGSWTRYGSSGGDSMLQELLDDWIRDMAEVTVLAERATGKGDGGGHLGGGYQLWSPEFMLTKRMTRRLRRLKIALRLEQCSEVTFRQEWEKLSSLLEQDAELEVGAVVTPVYMGDVGWRREWADWVLWSDTAMKVLRRKTHVNVRRDVREAWNKRELKVKELIAINKWNVSSRST